MNCCQTYAIPVRSTQINRLPARDLLAYVTPKCINGNAASLDLAKAFDSVEHVHLCSLLSAFGLPDSFVCTIQTLSTGISSALPARVEFNIATVAWRVRQGYPISPLIFVLTLEPLLPKIHQSRRVLGLLLPASDNITLTAYADDVTLFVRDANSIGPVFQLHGRTSEALLSTEKTTILEVGGPRGPLYLRTRVGDLDDASGCSLRLSRVSPSHLLHLSAAVCKSLSDVRR